MTEQSLRNVSATLKYGHQLEPRLLADVVFPRALLAMYITVTPVTTTATAVQNSIENPADHAN